MNASEYREMSVAELEREEALARERLFKLRFQISMGQAEGVRKYRATRKDLARILTVAGEKLREPGPAPKGGSDG